MSISAVQSISVSGQKVNATNGMAQVKKDFDAIGTALESGDIAAAKKAYEQLKKDAPSKGDGNDPMSKMMKELGDAIDSGDLDTAKQQYAKIKEDMSKNPPPGGKGGAKGGAKPAGGASGSDSSKIYDVRDTNKDGKVSTAEQLAYDLKNSQKTETSNATQSTSAESDNDAAQGSIDLQA